MIGKYLKRLSPIGLDVGAESVKAVQLARRGEGWVLHAAGSMARSKPGVPMDGAEAEKVASALDRRGFVFGRVVVGVPSGTGGAAVLELPSKGSGAPVEQIARGEMARAMRCEPGALEVGVWELPPAGKPQAGAPTPSMAVACRSVEADALVGTLSEAGMDVAALDAPCLALERACGAWLAAQAVNAIVDLGSATARAVVTVGKTVIYERALPEGSMAELRAAVAGELKVEPDVAQYLVMHHGLDGAMPEDEAVRGRVEEARHVVRERLESLIEEVQASAQYAGGRYVGVPPGRILLVGAAAGMPGIAAFITQRTEIEARVVRPSDAAEVPAKLNEAGRDPGLCLAAGLALWREEDVL